MTCPRCKDAPLETARIILQMELDYINLGPEGLSPAGKIKESELLLGCPSCGLKAGKRREAL